MINRIRLAVAASAAALLCATALAQTTYQKPPKAILDVLNAPRLPQVSLSPAKTHILLLDTVANPSIADLSRPMLRLAGLRIDPGSNGPHLTAYTTGVSVQSLAGGAATRVAVPANARLHALSWSPDGKLASVANATETTTELWVLDIATAKARKIAGVALNGVLDPISWMPDNKTLLVATVPAGRGKAPVAPATPLGPKIQESTGKAGPTRTYQDMLTSSYDEQLFDFYATAQLALVDVATGKVTPVGKPGIYSTISPSPGGQHFLLTRHYKPYSYLLPVQLFTRDVEVWDLKGSLAYTVAKLPLAERVPIEGVPTGPRNVNWQPSQADTLVWVEALDGGNPKEKVPHRDRVLSYSLSAKAAPAEVGKTENRLQGGFFGGGGIMWLEDGRLLVSDYDPRKRWTRTMLVEKGGATKTVFNRNIQDRYKDPGQIQMKTLASGGRVVDVADGQVLLKGDGASPQGDRPFVDRMSLATLKTERLFQSAPDKYQELIGALDKEGKRLLIRSESPTEPPNYFIRDAAGKLTAVTNFADPSPQLRGIKKQLVTYNRPDGVPLSFTLYLPPNYQPGKPLPTVVWAYPREFNDADTAGQVSGSRQRFSTLTGYSHLFFLLDGYAVLDETAMPVVGDPETVNNTYIDQIVASAKAAIDKAVEMGVTDRNRVGVGGHSYGAFMTANLLAHSDLFRAGIARSGAYNRTLTPFGFQSERRTLWEASDIYLKMSPFMFADKIKEPMLMIHGEADNNQGTFPIQSDRMYQAVRGNGGTVRLVFLPFESHGYSARETIEHVLSEQIGWFDKYVKRAGELTSQAGGQ
ncbi:MAG: prolyl oligopeptidase family serine peptidase [Acidobacteria bacterium]|nr:prolyl oligopeptidase family serine peptidase [Acidobacteriota bacterium]